MQGAGTRRIAITSAAVAFVLVVSALVAASVAAYGQRVRDTGNELARTIPHSYRDARVHYPSPAATLKASLAGVPISGWHVRLHDPAALGGASGPESVTAALAATLGIVPKRIAVDDATIDIVPDFGGFARAGELEALAIVAVFAFGIAVLYRARTRAEG